MEWITRLSGGEVVELSVGDADQVLGVGRLIREEDTKISGPIRIVEVDGLVAVLEQTPKNVILIRALPSIADAQRLVEDRLEIYDRMWDGCGCKVNYFS